MYKSNSILRQDLERVIGNYKKAFAKIMRYNPEILYSVGGDCMDILCVGDYEFWQIDDVITLVDFYDSRCSAVPEPEHEKIREDVEQQSFIWCETRIKWHELQRQHRELREHNFMNLRSWLAGAPREFYHEKLNMYSNFI